MIWLTWRQFRFPAAVVFGALAVLARARCCSRSACPRPAIRRCRVFSNERDEVAVYTFATIAMLVAPAVIGMFWGAPLVARELEAGTHRLIWNQSVTRTRWLVTKVRVDRRSPRWPRRRLGLLLTWWAGPIDDAQIAGQEAQGIVGASRMARVFISRGIVPVGYFAVRVRARRARRHPHPPHRRRDGRHRGRLHAVQLAVPPLVRAHLTRS